MKHLVIGLRKPSSVLHTADGHNYKACVSFKTQTPRVWSKLWFYNTEPQLKANGLCIWRRSQSNMGTLALVENEHACLRVSILFLLLDAKVLYKKKWHTCFSGDKSVPNTFRLTAQTKWRSKRQMHKHARKHARTLKSTNICVEHRAKTSNWTFKLKPTTWIYYTSLDSGSNW